MTEPKGVIQIDKHQDLVDRRTFRQKMLYLDMTKIDLEEPLPEAWSEPWGYGE